MGIDIDRIEQDRALFERGVRDQLHSVLDQGSRQIVAKAIEQAIRAQVVTEEFIRSKGVEFNSQELGLFAEENRAFIKDQVERAITKFICSIVSQES